MLLKRVVAVGFIALCAGIVCGNVPEAEKEALVSIFNATNGQNWTITWNDVETTDPCVGKWYGVTCNVANTSVECVRVV